jgi:uncharacterized membrane protein
MISSVKLMCRLFVAGFRIIGYIMVFILQVILYLRLGGKYKIGDAVGQLGKGVIDALADVVRG